MRQLLHTLGQRYPTLVARGRELGGLILDGSSGFWSVLRPLLPPRPTRATWPGIVRRVLRSLGTALVGIGLALLAQQHGVTSADLWDRGVGSFIGAGLLGILLSGLPEFLHRRDLTPPAWVTHGVLWIQAFLARLVSLSLTTWIALLLLELARTKLPPGTPLNPVSLPSFVQLCWNILLLRIWVAVFMIGLRLLVAAPAPEPTSEPVQ